MGYYIMYGFDDNLTLDELKEKHGGPKGAISSIEMAIFWGNAYHEDEIREVGRGYGFHFCVVDEDGVMVWEGPFNKPCSTIRPKPRSVQLNNPTVLEFPKEVKLGQPARHLRLVK